MTRTREEVLREFDMYPDGKLVDAMAARIAALEAEVARVTANQQPGEPVAWMAGFTNGEMSHVIWNERSAREWAAQSETRVVRPMKWSDDPDADLVVMDIPHPRPRVGVTEAMVEAAREAYRTAWWHEHDRAGEEPYTEEARNRIWRVALTAANAAAPAPTASGEGVVEAAVAYIHPPESDPWGYGDDERFDRLKERVTEYVDAISRASGGEGV